MRRLRNWREEVKRYGDDGVDREELNPFVPVGLSIHHQVGKDGHAEDDREHLERREKQIERMAERIGEEDQQRRNEKGDLYAGLHGDVERRVHLVARREK